MSDDYTKVFLAVLVGVCAANSDDHNRAASWFVERTADITEEAMRWLGGTSAEIEVE
jgi:hypothetical protein